VHHKLHAFARAARISGEQDAGHEEAGEDAVCLPAPVPLPLLKQRADKMFSGATGAAVASGDGEATSAPSLQLVKDIVDVIFALEKARPELFDRLAKQRPWEPWEGDYRPPSPPPPPPQVVSGRVDHLGLPVT